MAYLVNLLARYAGGFDRVTGLSVRFLSNVFAGDRLVAGGRVTAVDAETGKVDCEVWLRRNGDADDVVMGGSASVLPAA